MVTLRFRIPLLSVRFRLPHPFKEWFSLSVDCYKISAYRDDFFRVVRMRVASSCYLPSDEPHKEYAFKLDNALSRARSAVLEYALCNDWQWFGTLTFSKLRVGSRYDLETLCRVLMQWLQNMRKRYYPNLRYLLVPEEHQDGAWHFHGFFSGIPLSELPPFAPVDLLKEGYLEWTDYRLRFGWCSFAPVRSPEASAFYVTKYITKSLSKSVKLKGVHTHYQSRGLQRSIPIGVRTGWSPLLDDCCVNHNAFCSTGFFRLRDVFARDFADLVDMCDEVSDMYQSYVLTDPDTAQPLALVGGDDTDAMLQLVMDYFQGPFAGRTPYDLPPESSRCR